MLPVWEYWTQWRNALTHKLNVSAHANSAMLYNGISSCFGVLVPLACFKPNQRAHSTINHFSGAFIDFAKLKAHTLDTH